MRRALLFLTIGLLAAGLTVGVALSHAVSGLDAGVWADALLYNGTPPP